jgi:hypothetical protein
LKEGTRKDLVGDLRFRWNIIKIRGTEDDYQHCVNYVFKSFDNRYLKNHYGINLNRDNLVYGTGLNKYGRTKLNTNIKSTFSTSETTSNILNLLTTTTNTNRNINGLSDTGNDTNNLLKFDTINKRNWNDDSIYDERTEDEPTETTTTESPPNLNEKGSRLHRFILPRINLPASSNTS